MDYLNGRVMVVKLSLTPNDAVGFEFLSGHWVVFLLKTK